MSKKLTVVLGTEATGEPPYFVSEITLEYLNKDGGARLTEVYVHFSINQLLALNVGDADSFYSATRVDDYSNIQDLAQYNFKVNGLAYHLREIRLKGTENGETPQILGKRKGNP